MNVISNVLTSQRTLAFCFFICASPVALGMYERTEKHTYVQLCRHLVFPFACMALGLQWRVVLVDGEQKRVEKVMRMSGNDDKAPLKAIKQRMDEQQTWTTGLLKMWTAITMLTTTLTLFLQHYYPVSQYLHLPRYGTFPVLAPIPAVLMKHMYGVCVGVGSVCIMVCWYAFKPSAGDLSEFEPAEEVGKEGGKRGEKRKRGKGRR